MWKRSTVSNLEQCWKAYSPIDFKVVGKDIVVKLWQRNEASYLRWKEVFDVLEIVGVEAEGGGESME